MACLGGAVGNVADSRYALPGYRRVWVRGPGWPNHCVTLYSGVCLRLNSRQAFESLGTVSYLPPIVTTVLS